MKPEIIATIVYASALLPAIVLIILAILKKLPKWVLITYLLSFVICALGWEIWFTYGLMEGQDVNMRRPDQLNRLIPQDINWLMNSLADAGICISGILYVWIFSSFNSDIFEEWKWKEFVILTIFFLFQNLIVELFIYQAQLAAGYQISWAPLAPNGLGGILNFSKLQENLFIFRLNYLGLL